MALVTKRQCDVFKTTKAVERYRLTLTTLGGDEPADSDVEMLSQRIDLSSRGLARLEKFIRRGMTAPSEGERDEQKKGGDDAASTHGQTSLMPNLQGLGEPAESEES